MSRTRYRSGVIPRILSVSSGVTFCTSTSRRTLSAGGTSTTATAGIIPMADTSSCVGRRYSVLCARAPIYARRRLAKPAECQRQAGPVVAPVMSEAAESIETNADEAIVERELRTTRQDRRVAQLG